MDVLRKQDMAIRQIPEVASVVGKLGRVDSALDPAPVSMFETVINYKSEYKEDPVTGKRSIDPLTEKPVRQWREHIKTPDDIWNEIVKAGKVVGTTSAPRLQPIAARLVMLQSGMRAPMGVKIKGKSLEEIEKVGFQIEQLLKEVPSVEASAVIADRVVGKPYMEIDIDRKAIARYGISVQKFQDTVEVAIGGRKITTTVEGRERYPVRVRYMRELRDNLESLGQILVPASNGAQIPVSQLAEIKYVRGPQVIKSEDTFLVGYVLFDKKPGYAEVDVVEECHNYLQEKINTGELKLPAGTTFTFAGTYENQVRSEKKLAIVLPLALFIIFLILYFQFKKVSTTFLVFLGIIVSWSGGFLMIWLYSQPWFLNFSVFGVSMKELFNVHPFNLSVAVWVGFIALFGIASDDGVVIATYLDQTFEKEKPSSIQEIRNATVHAGSRRIRPCLMTTATTILALIPVLTSKGRGADVMVPMAIPSFGGMCIELVTLFVVPVIYCMLKEFKVKKSS
jgi:Cu(I)/Ag(I) efflux system membrane protein CusA/SilA